MKKMIMAILLVAACQKTATPQPEAAPPDATVCPAPVLQYDWSLHAYCAEFVAKFCAKVSSCVMGQPFDVVECRSLGMEYCSQDGAGLDEELLADKEKFRTKFLQCLVEMQTTSCDDFGDLRRLPACAEITAKENNNGTVQ
jgi:hypothetical protein